MPIKTYLTKVVDTVLPNGRVQRDPSAYIVARGTGANYKKGRAHHSKWGKSDWCVYTCWADDFAAIDADPNSIELASHAGESFSGMLAALDVQNQPGGRPAVNVRSALAQYGWEGITGATRGATLRQIMRRFEPMLDDFAYERNIPKIKQTITDTFTGTAGTALSTYNAGWQHLVGTEMVILTGGARGHNPDNYSRSIARRSEAVFPNDHYVELDVDIVTNDGDNCHSPAIRVNASGHCYMIVTTSGGGSALRDWDGSSENYLADDGGATLSTGVDYTFRLEASGTTITVDRNGSEVISTTDSTYSSGKPGIYATINGTGSSFDNFACTDATLTQPSRTGTAQNFDTGGASSGTNSATIPSDCEAVVCFWHHWNSNGNTTITSLDFGGTDSFTLLQNVGDTGDANGGGVAICYPTSTGTRNFNWAASASGWSEGGTFHLTYIKDVNWVDVVRDSDFDSVGSSGGTNATITLTTEANDLVLAFDESASGAGQSGASTVYVNDHSYNSNVTDISDYDTVGATSTVVTGTQDYYPAVGGIALKPSGGTVGGGGASIGPSGISSLEAFGSAEVRAARSITGSGVVSEEAFGTASINHNVAASAIATAEAFGTAMAKLNVTGSGIASLEAIGDATVNAAGGAIQPSGIASAEAFGDGALTLSLLASAIASLEAFGTGQLNHNVAPSGIASAEAIGTQELSVLAQVIAPEGIAPGNMGNPTISGGDATPQGGWILRMRRRRNR